jgi:hypothetical protein
MRSGSIGSPDWNRQGGGGFAGGGVGAVRPVAGGRARHAKVLRAQGDPRRRDQIMADTLVERLTGQASAADVTVEVQLLMPLASLLDPTDSCPATIPGHGVIPAELVRRVIGHSAGRRWWRRLFTAPAGMHPAGAESEQTEGAQPSPDDAAGRPPADGVDPSSASGPMVAGDPARRQFDGWLAELIKLRDQGVCRDPCCDAPIRHLDHIRRHTDGGPTTLVNGRGVCERGNYVREMPGWKITMLDDGLHGSPHSIMITTPTGHSYQHRTPTAIAGETRASARTLLWRSGEVRSC